MEFARSTSKNFIIGLNPALQKRILFHNTVTLGEVNRAEQLTVGIGGKGQDVLLASSQLPLISRDSIPNLVQFIGEGSEGDQVLRCIEDIYRNYNNNDTCHNQSPHITVRTKGRCRTCITLIDRERGQSTEIIEPSSTIAEEETTCLLNIVDNIMKQNRENEFGLSIMGSMPPLCRPTLYVDFIELICQSNSKIILDTTVELIPSIKAAAKHRNKLILKINKSELRKVVSNLLQRDGNITQIDTLDSNSLVELAYRNIKDIIADCPGNFEFYLAMTDGAKPISFKTSQLPVLSLWCDLSRVNIDIVNCIGAGDTVVAGMLNYWTKQVDKIDYEFQVAKLKEQLVALKIEDLETNILHTICALSFGNCCAIASCTREENSMFDSNLAFQLFEYSKYSV